MITFQGIIFCAHIIARILNDLHWSEINYLYIKLADLILFLQLSNNNIIIVANFYSNEKPFNGLVDIKMLLLHVICNNTKQY